ncbi:hypothetical protein ACFQE1_02185 [Halobium palmae]|uniref:Uncharacterized protein n=1 Tax=Halobium palmae TaxID=1776492 RepID=A0ABD5RV79_9EURY
MSGITVTGLESKSLETKMLDYAQDLINGDGWPVGPEFVSLDDVELNAVSPEYLHEHIAESDEDALGSTRYNPMIEGWCRIYIRDDLTRECWEAVLRHELVHAAQVQSAAELSHDDFNWWMAESRLGVSRHTPLETK